MEPVPGKYRLPIEHLPDVFAYHQVITYGDGKPVDYIFLDVNKAYEEMIGLTREEIIGKRSTHILPGVGESVFDWIGTCGKVALTGESTCFEQYSEPLKRWYAITAYSDEPGFFAVTFKDITGNINELLEREKNIRYVAEFLPLPLSILDSKGNYEYLNPAFTKVFGYTLSHIPTKKHWFDLAFPDPIQRQKQTNLWKNDTVTTGQDLAIPRSFRITCHDLTEKDIAFWTVSG